MEFTAVPHDQHLIIVVCDIFEHVYTADLWNNIILIGKRTGMIPLHGIASNPIGKESLSFFSARDFKILCTNSLCYQFKFYVSRIIQAPKYCCFFLTGVDLYGLMVWYISKDKFVKDV